MRNPNTDLQRTLRSLKALSVASMKMYFRNRGAVIFTLILPLVLLSVFGFLSRGGGGPRLTIAITNHSQTELARNFTEAIKNMPAFKIQELSEPEAASALGKGNADLQIIVPEQFGAADSSTGGLKPAKIETHYNEATPQTGQVANLIVQQIATDFNTRLSNTPQIISVAASGVKTNNLGFFDFILPGILSMTIMQLGIFGVSFAFVSHKASGALRRIQATPIHPRIFIFAQAITRLIMTFITVLFLLSLGIYFFDFHMVGNFIEFAAVTVLGIIVFLGFGFAIAGWAKDENQVAPVANIIQLPMLMLSGVFFSRDAFPGWLKAITDYLPLTFLSESLRHIANEGQHVTQMPGNILGLLVWGVVIFAVAIYLFRWE